MIQYRPPTLADCAELAVFNVRCWQEAYAGMMDAEFLRVLSVEKRLENWTKTLADQEVFVQLAIDEGNIIGFISSGPSRTVAYADGEVYGLYVARSHYQRGIGSKLFRAAQTDWQKRSGQSLLVRVVEQNLRGRSFYAAMGMVEVDDAPRVWHGMSVNEKICVLNLATS